MPSTAYHFLCLFDLFFFFRDRVSLCSVGCPGIHDGDEADLELTKICLLSAAHLCQELPRGAIHVFLDHQERVQYNGFFVCTCEHMYVCVHVDVCWRGE